MMFPNEPLKPENTKIPIEQYLDITGTKEDWGSIKAISKQTVREVIQALEALIA